MDFFLFTEANKNREKTNVAIKCQVSASECAVFWKIVCEHTYTRLIRLICDSMYLFCLSSVEVDVAVLFDFHIYNASNDARMFCKLKSLTMHSTTSRVHVCLCLHVRFFFCVSIVASWGDCISLPFWTAVAIYVHIANQTRKVNYVNEQKTNLLRLNINCLANWHEKKISPHADYHQFNRNKFDKNAIVYIWFGHFGAPLTTNCVIVFVAQANKTENT